MHSFHSETHDLNTRDFDTVRTEVTSIYQKLFPSASQELLDNAFRWINDAFSGRYRDYQPIDAKYHDLEHTLQGTLAFARLLNAYRDAALQPEINQRYFELGLLAILLHDTGYLKMAGDTEGTGAKYTLTHVARSADFARTLLSEKGFSPQEIRSVQNMIRCTGVNADLSSIPFSNDVERKVGHALGTADLLGQMAAPDYVEKLETLYQEFEESNRYTGKATGPAFSSADDLRAQTPLFWERYVLPKIETDFGGLYRLLADPQGRNPYIEGIHANIARLQQLDSR